MALPEDVVKWATTHFADTSRASDYSTYASYYDGRQALRFASEKMAASLRGIFDALTYNRCVAPDTPIWTRRGIVRADAVTSDDQVIGHDGEWHWVTQARVIPTDEPLVTIASRCAPPITVTRDHPLLVTPASSLRFITSKYATEAHARVAGVKARASFRVDTMPRQWVTAEDLRLRDVIWGALPPRAAAIPDGITPDHIHLLGWYLAEGSVSRIGRACFSLHEDETAFADEIRALLDACFGATSTVQPDRPGSRGIGVVTYSKIAAEWLVRWGGAGCDRKAIHPDLFFSGADLGPLLAAAWAGDGDTMGGGQGRARYGTTSFALAAQLHAILLQHGIAASWSTRHPVGKRPAHSLSIGGSHARALGDLIGGQPRATPYDKAPNGIVDDGLLGACVVSLVEAPPVGAVVALTVEGSASYTHPGSISSHNCAPVVDAIADRIHLVGFVDTAGASVKPADDLWAENRMDKREGEVNQETLTTGDGYAIVWPNVVTGRPTIWPEDAANIRVLWDDEQPGLIIMAAKYWVDSNGYGRLNLYLPNRLEKYITVNKATGILPTTGFERFQGESDLTWPLVYPWFREGIQNVPVFHFGNNARTGRYGRSELRDVIPLQDGLNTTLAKLMAASEDAAVPRLTISGWTPKRNEVTGKAQDPFERNVKPYENINERTAAFPNPETTVNQLPTIDLTQLIALSEAFDLMVARVSRIPVHYLGLSGDFPSGESLKTADAPFVRKIEDRQTAFGNVWEDAMSLAVRQSGIDLAFQLTAKYEPAEPRSDKEQADLAVQYSVAGLPLEAILRLALGLDDAEIAKVMASAQALVPQLADQIEAGAMDDEDEEGAA